MVGDIFGAVGMRAIEAALPGLKDRYQPHIVVVNAENAAAGSGTTPTQATSLFAAGADVLTGGNHTFRRPEFISTLETDPRVLRPANLTTRGPGSGTVVVDARGGFRVGVINLIGSVFINAAQSPFAVVDDLVDRMRRDTPLIFIDIHAEATSEKVAMGHHLDGRVTAVVGTHTHVPTADERVLTGGTAYISDLGMTGPHDSVIGVKREAVLRTFLTGMPARFEPATGDVRVQGVFIEADPTGRAVAIERFDLPA
ncbi:MAG: TIGR00282 family metallophosphoesterase [Thermoleophilia bacterium]|nr:TIGR00282 family metallophosphoesterase [Thermoleophilia bacterium]